MSAQPSSNAPARRRPALLLAEYASPAAVLHAAEMTRDAGYKRFDTHTPFPVHGMDRAMGMRDSKVGWIVLFMALTGLSFAVALMVYTNGIDYPIIVGGKPPNSIPSMVPVMFELTVLFSAFGAVLGMFYLNGLPRHHHPIFESDRFRAASDDKFFLSIEAIDPKFDREKTSRFLESTHAESVELLDEEVA